MIWIQKTVELAPRSRGFHLITDEVVHALPELRAVRAGLLHVFIQHTSASLALNEDASPDVLEDLEVWFRKAVPDSAPYVHREEGPDDMPAHIRSVLTGSSLTIPVGSGRLLLGTWQGLYLGEHRTRAGRRRLVLTLSGESPA